jgi:hypothetical protein
MELVCGPGYTEQQAETICRAGWTVDAVHPTAHTFTKMALNLMETITPGVRGREQSRPRQTAPMATQNQAAATTSPGRKRARSETPGPAPRSEDRSTERSRKWPQIREQRRAATYDEEFFHSISSSSRGGHDQPSYSRGQQSGQRGGYTQPSPARGNHPQSGRGGGYTPHYSFTPPPPSTTRRASTWAAGAAGDAATGAGEAGEVPAFRKNGTEEAGTAGLAINTTALELLDLNRIRHFLFCHVLCNSHFIRAEIVSFVNTIVSVSVKKNS